ncbi:MAG: hypothetical protein KAG56_01175, partial [Sulfurovaceae bacterium]|nr:hypothetical protein [Sulfurovaceae bacterium]
NVTQMNGMLWLTSLSTQNYDSLLIGWSGLGSLQPNVTLDVYQIKYSTTGETERQSIIDTYGWTINDGGKIYAGE